MNNRPYFPKRVSKSPDDVAEIIYAMDAVYDCSLVRAGGGSFAETCRGWIDTAPTPRVKRALQDFMGRYVADQGKGRK
jgi:hypothetical protein